MRFLILCFAIFTSSFAMAKDAPKWENTCDVFFAPDDQLIDQLVHLIDHENTSIKVAVSNLSHPKIVRSLVMAKKRGVNVEVILDATSHRAKKTLSQLAQAGIPVYLYEAKDVVGKKGVKDLRQMRSPHMLNRFCLFGKNEHQEKLVWSGTFNFTNHHHEKSRENAVVASIEKMVNKYEREFKSMKHDAVNSRSLKIAKR